MLEEDPDESGADEAVAFFSPRLATAARPSEPYKASFSPGSFDQQSTFQSTLPDVSNPSR
jgi:hypothetical protein